MQNPNGAKLLVVDDDPVIRELFSMGLEDQGFSVTVASNGREAIEILQRMVPAAVVLDMAMPESSGLAVIQCLRDRPETREVPVLAVTGLDPDDELWAGRDWGWDLYVRKPVDTDELGAKIRALLNL